MTETVRVAVLGGAGFIGSAVVRELNRRGMRPLVFDLLTYAGRPENLQGTDHEFVRGDIRGPELHEALSRFRPEVIINLAAETHVDRSIYSPQDFVTTNVIGAVNVLEAARRLGVRLLHVSTDEVFGDASVYGCADESSPLRPSSPYSASKASAEHFVLAYVRTYGLEALVARPSNNYGPRQHPEKLIPKAIIRTLLGLEVPVYGSGLQRRDWMYVEDTARLLVDLALKGEAGRGYNLPGGHVATNLEILGLIGRALGREVKIKHVEDRPGHDVEYCMRPSFSYWTTPLEDGIGRTVRWYIENQEWWRPLLGNKFFVNEVPWRSVG
ncbi:DTDP-glucose 4,6-dehydratase [Acidilobus saccharovorans 345-15]|uniref:dTDP-glucose 4,6-dehydratase n=1 Tax=Acidilobus saccharovorans (strain DSM 16705 / JCM 18335 / VKM B-2471 / 345-15) TaxID=666510 RepID=D9Q179_ACIS3|nr:dTDP-glucose 4,6-dehydratase [Acidilobus saccharovorans]ADL19067.1 DTDP-glucose 4,6-dehydratase [Acidilobus saccharovorans 345-15]